MMTIIDSTNGVTKELQDPHEVPYPNGPLWNRLGHELVYGRDPVRVAYEYGESVKAVNEINDSFWDGYSRFMWLAEAEEYGLLEELVQLDNDTLHARLLKERQLHDSGADLACPTEPTGKGATR